MLWHNLPRKGNKHPQKIHLKFPIPNFIKKQSTKLNDGSTCPEGQQIRPKKRTIGIYTLKPATTTPLPSQINKLGNEIKARALRLKLRSIKN